MKGWIFLHTAGDMEQIASLHTVPTQIGDQPEVLLMTFKRHFPVTKADVLLTF